MNIARIIEREMGKSGGSVKMVPVPEGRKPTAASIREMDDEITAQVRANEAMRSRSMIRSSKTYRR